MPFDPNAAFSLEGEGFDPAKPFALEDAAPNGPSARASAPAPGGRVAITTPSLQPGVPQAFPTAQQDLNAAQARPADTLEAIEQIATTPFVTIPRAGAPGTVLRGVSEVGSGLVEQALLTPASGLIDLATAIPGVRAIAGAALATSAAKSAAEKLGEASVTGNVQTATEGVLTAGLAGLGAVGVGRDIAASRPGVFTRELVDANTKRIIPMSAEVLEKGPLQLPAPRTRMPEFTESTLEPEGPPLRALPAPGESTAGGYLMPASSIAEPVAGHRIALPIEPEAAKLARQVWAKPIDVEAQVTGVEALRSLVTITDEAKTPGQPYQPPSVSVDLRQLEAAMKRNTVSRVESWADETVRNKLRDVSANPYFDPEFLAAAAVKAAILVKRGVTGFAEWSGEMRKQFGPGIEERLGPLFEQATKAYGVVDDRKKVSATESPVTPPATPAAQEPTANLTGMGGAIPSEFRPPPQTTSTKNAVVDQERAARGLPPAVQPLRRSFGATWDDAMAKIDADPALQDKLLADLRANPRAATDTENALILHRQVDLQNEYGKATRDLAQAVDDGRAEDAATQRARVADLSDRLLDIYNIGKKVGTETGRGLAARRMLADQDFTLANMVTERRAASGGKRLTPRQEAETAQAHAEIATAINEAATKPSVEADFKLDRAKKKWAGKLADDADANAPVPTRALAKVGNALNDIRTIRTSFDLSALLRQGKLALVTRPGVWARAIGPSIRAAASPLAAFRIDHQIANRHNAPLYARSGLYIAEAGHKLTGQEEAFLTRGVARHLPGVKASERAYTTFLNKLRADLFDTFVATLSRDGETVTLPEAKVIANYINVMTGRGDLAKFNAAAVPMATVFFAPRYVASRFQYLLGQPLYYGALSGKVAWREGARARRLVAGEYARALIGISTLYGLYAVASEQQNFDPYSSDFLKLRSGNTRLDPFAGLQQATVLLSREAGGQKTTLKGKTQPIRGNVPYGGATAVDVGTQFLRSKLAPVPGALVNALQGKNIVGEPVTLGSTVLDLTVPITYQDILDTLEDQGVTRATALSLLSFFGEGVQTYQTAPKRTK